MRNKPKPLVLMLFTSTTCFVLSLALTVDLSLAEPRSQTSPTKKPRAKARQQTRSIASTKIIDTGALTGLPIKIGKPEWLARFKFQFTRGFCDQSKLMKECYAQTVETCRSDVKNALNLCARRTKLPERITEGDESQLFGENMGQCLGDELHRLHRESFSRIPACTNPFEWM